MLVLLPPKQKGPYQVVSPYTALCRGSPMYHCYILTLPAFNLYRHSALHFCPEQEPVTLGAANFCQGHQPLIISTLSLPCSPSYVKELDEYSLLCYNTYREVVQILLHKSMVLLSYLLLRLSYILSFYIFPL